MKIVKNIALLVIATSGVYLGMVWLMLQVNYQDKPLLYPATGHVQPPGGQAWYMLHEFKKAEEYDLIIIGSSHAYRGYDIRKFNAAGYKSYNLGSSNQNIINTYVLVENLIPKGWTGRLILDIYEETLVNESIESTVNLIANVKEGALARKIAFKSRDVRCINMLTARLFTEDLPEYEDGSYKGSGYCSRTDKLSPDFVKPPMQKFKPSDKALEYFKKLLSLLKERNIEYVITIHPTPDTGNLANHKAFLKVVEPVINVYNATFLNCAYQLDLSPIDHFYDETHLNQAGVDIYNAWLIDKLKKR